MGYTDYVGGEKIMVSKGVTKVGERKVKTDSAACDKQLIVSKLKSFLSPKPEIVFGYLFGSQATGSAGRLSDIDLAVYIDPSFRPPQEGYGYQSELIAELSAFLGTTVDVVLLNNASILLKHQVLKKGVLIHSRSHQERRSFHERTIRAYLDFKPLLKTQHEYMRKRIFACTLGSEENG